MPLVGCPGTHPRDRNLIEFEYGLPAIIASNDPDPHCAGGWVRAGDPVHKATLPLVSVTAKPAYVASSVHLGSRLPRLKE